MIFDETKTYSSFKNILMFDIKKNMEGMHIKTLGRFLSLVTDLQL